PTFIQPIVSSTVPHGEVARFHACVSGTPKPEISWFHEQEPVKPNKNVVFHYDEMTNVATLIIVDAFSEHAGRYTCKATNAAGEAVCTATLAVTREGELTMFPPEFLQKMSPEFIRMGEMTELKCQFHGDPQPSVSWLKDGQPIMRDPDFDVRIRANSSTLTIYYPTSYHQGIFACHISNKHGEASSSCTLKVIDDENKTLPETPQEVKVTEEESALVEEQILEEELDYNKNVVQHCCSIFFFFSFIHTFIIFFTEYNFFTFISLNILFVNLFFPQ
ncbi:titin-like, partial [Astyanax mexicanus]